MAIAIRRYAWVLVGVEWTLGALLAIAFGYIAITQAMQLGPSDGLKRTPHTINLPENYLLVPSVTNMPQVNVTMKEYQEKRSSATQDVTISRTVQPPGALVVDYYDVSGSFLHARETIASPGYSIDWLGEIRELGFYYPDTWVIEGNTLLVSRHYQVTSQWWIGFVYLVLGLIAWIAAILLVNSSFKKITSR